MPKLDITDEQIIDSFRRTKSYMATARELGMLNRQTVHYRIMSIKARGVELPAPLGKGKQPKSKPKSI